MIPRALVASIDLGSGTFRGRPLIRRYLRDMAGCFADPVEFDRRAAAENPLVYSVSTIEPAQGSGDLHFGLGVLMPGRIGTEYFMTKGHFHARREAAEVYVGLQGSGGLLLEREGTRESQLILLEANAVAYVPGRTAHRTVNFGNEPLVYLGIYPADAGHDYDGIARDNFRCLVVEREGRPTVIERATGRRE